MLCPKDQKNLRVREHEGHVGYACESCHGAWLPRQFIYELEKARDFPAERFSNMLLNNAAGSSEHQCPNNCGVLGSTSVEGVPLEWCGSCGGVWFDETELGQAIRKMRLREAKDGLQASDALLIPDLLNFLLLFVK